MEYNIVEIEKELISNKMEINYYVDMIGHKYKNFNVNNNMGLYVFWYYNRTEKLNNLNRNLIINGPSKIKQNIEWNWNLANEYVCLYV
jgi:hypothetical protein